MSSDITSCPSLSAPFAPFPAVGAFALPPMLPPGLVLALELWLLLHALRSIVGTTLSPRSVLEHVAVAALVLAAPAACKPPPPFVIPLSAVLPPVVRQTFFALLLRFVRPLFFEHAQPSASHHWPCFVHHELSFHFHSLPLALSQHSSFALLLVHPASSSVVYPPAPLAVFYFLADVSDHAQPFRGHTLTLPLICAWRRLALASLFSLDRMSDHNPADE